MANTDYFSKRWDDVHGFTQQEAEEKMRNVDESYGANLPNAKWHHAKMVPDPAKKDGYMVTITAK